MIGLWSELSAVSVLQLAVVARLALAIVMSGELSVAEHGSQKRRDRGFKL